jgi:putative toxin-antitoxin system antitoxin component (TIGR02293 family)
MARNSESRHRARFRNRGSSLGLHAASSAELIQNVERGLSFQALQSLASHTGITVAHLAPILGIPERTLARRKSRGKLSMAESERLLRLSSVFEKAVELFEGDISAAVKWLNTPNKALANNPPLAYSRTELGAREVEMLIGRLEHGVVS